MQAKLNPQVPSSPSSTSLVGKLNFPGFQEILDFTSAGSESSVSVTVDGDTDKEYRIVVRILNPTNVFRLRLNNVSTAASYGQQYLANVSGTISAARSADDGCIAYYRTLSRQDTALLTPSGLIKTAFNVDSQYTSGTTIGLHMLRGYSFNSTANITSLDFVMETGNFTSGTRICVFARRSQS